MSNFLFGASAGLFFAAGYLRFWVKRASKESLLDWWEKYQ